MHRLMLLAALLTPITPLYNIKGSSVSEHEEPRSSTTLSPMVFKNPLRSTAMIPKQTGLIKARSDALMLNYIFDSYATSNKHFHDKFKAPSFEGDKSTEDTVIEADTGATVFFECQVSSLRDKMVSWLKVSNDNNLELLTLDLETHTADLRYHVDLAGETWRLSLYNAKETDSGIYCCHVSTHPPMLKHFQLTVHRPEIKLTKEAFLEASETLSLKCMIVHLHSEEVIPVLRWYKENYSTPLDEMRGGVLIETDLLTLTSQLQVAELKVADAGNYTCVLEAPMKIKAVARVHVLQGSSLAELHCGVTNTTSYLNLLLAAILVVFGSYTDVR